MNFKKNIKDKNQKKQKLKYIDEDSNSRLIDNFGTLDIDKIQLIIKKIVYWYMVKFPDQDLVINKNNVSIIKNDFKENNSDYMTLEQLNIRLSCSVINAFECKYISDYRIDSSVISYISDLKESDSYIFIKLMYNSSHLFRKSYDKDCLIVSDKDGTILSIIGNNLLLDEIKENSETINLEQLLCILKKSQRNNLDFYYLDECVKKRKKDVAIRDKIINIIATKLLFDATREEYGYFRASQFLNDFNTLYSLNLDNGYLDEIIRKHNEDTLKNDNQCNKKSKSLVKSKKSCYG